MFGADLGLKNPLRLCCPLLEVTAGEAVEPDLARLRGLLVDFSGNDRLVTVDGVDALTIDFDELTALGDGIMTVVFVGDRVVPLEKLFVGESVPSIDCEDTTFC